METVRGNVSGEEMAGDHRARPCKIEQNACFWAEQSGPRHYDAALRKGGTREGESS